MSKPIVLVTGANGNTGKEVTLALLNHFKDSITVQAGVRSKDKGQDLEKSGAILVETDFNNAEKSLHGVERIWLTAPNPQKTDKPFDRIILAKKVVDAAKKAGVKFILLGSVLGAANESFVFEKEFRDLEKHIEASGIPHTFVRMIAFTENAIGSKGAFEQGVYPQPLGNGSFSPVSVVDVGLISATILANPEKHKGKHYDLTGPESLSGEQQAAAVGRVLGKEIKYINSDKEETVKIFEAWFAPYQARGLVELYGLYENGKAVHVSPDFKNVTGKEGTKFEDRIRQLHQWGVL